jgi:mannosyltransferase OCH1-like enzyme
MNIPKKLWHIWIGPKPAPLRWMNTWPEMHPEWEYTVFNNELLNSTKFHNQHLIDEYLTMPHHDGYAGAADLIRYELLYKYGGFMPGADASCLNNTDELWVEERDVCYTVYESEILRPSYVSPIYAANPGNEFLEILINDLHNLTPADLHKKKVFMTTGNGYLPDMIKKHNPKIKIFPSYYFIPCHYSTSHRYQGNDKVYAEQYWGSTKKNYHTGV